MQFGSLSPQDCPVSLTLQLCFVQKLCTPVVAWFPYEQWLVVSPWLWTKPYFSHPSTAATVQPRLRWNCGDQVGNTCGCDSWSHSKTNKIQIRLVVPTTLKNMLINQPTLKIQVNQPSQTLGNKRTCTKTTNHQIGCIHKSFQKLYYTLRVQARGTARVDHIVPQNLWFLRYFGVKPRVSLWNPGFKQFPRCREFRWNNMNQLATIRSVELDRSGETTSANRKTKNQWQ